MTQKKLILFILFGGYLIGSCSSGEGVSDQRNQAISDEEEGVFTFVDDEEIRVLSLVDTGEAKQPLTFSLRLKQAQIPDDSYVVIRAVNPAMVTVERIRYAHRVILKKIAKLSEDAEQNKINLVKLTHGAERLQGQLDTLIQSGNARSQIIRLNHQDFNTSRRARFTVDQLGSLKNYKGLRFKLYVSFLHQNAQQTRLGIYQFNYKLKPKFFESGYVHVLPINHMDKKFIEVKDSCQGFANYFHLNFSLQALSDRQKKCPLVLLEYHQSLTTPEIQSLTTPEIKPVIKLPSIPLRFVGRNADDNKQPIKVEIYSQSLIQLQAQESELLTLRQEITASKQDGQSLSDSALNAKIRRMFSLSQSLRQTLMAEDTKHMHITMGDSQWDSEGKAHIDLPEDLVHGSDSFFFRLHFFASDSAGGFVSRSPTQIVSYDELNTGGFELDWDERLAEDQNSRQFAECSKAFGDKLSSAGQVDFNATDKTAKFLQMIDYLACLPLLRLYDSQFHTHMQQVLNSCDQLLQGDPSHVQPCAHRAALPFSLSIQVDRDVIDDHAKIGIMVYNQAFLPLHTLEQEKNTQYQKFLQRMYEDDAVSIRNTHLMPLFQKILDFKKKRAPQYRESLQYTTADINSEGLLTLPITSVAKGESFLVQVATLHAQGHSKNIKIHESRHVLTEQLLQQQTPLDLRSADKWQSLHRDCDEQYLDFFDITKAENKHLNSFNFAAVGLCPDILAQRVENIRLSNFTHDYLPFNNALQFALISELTFLKTVTIQEQLTTEFVSHVAESLRLAKTVKQLSLHSKQVTADSQSLQLLAEKLAQSQFHSVLLNLTASDYHQDLTPTAELLQALLPLGQSLELSIRLQQTASPEFNKVFLAMQQDTPAQKQIKALTVDNLHDDDASAFCRALEGYVLSGRNNTKFNISQSQLTAIGGDVIYRCLKDKLDTLTAQEPAGDAGISVDFDQDALGTELKKRLTQDLQYNENP